MPHVHVTRYNHLVIPALTRPYRRHRTSDGELDAPSWQELMGSYIRSLPSCLFLPTRRFVMGLYFGFPPSLYRP